MNLNMPVPDQPLRILLAEDNAVNQRVANLILKRAGFTVDSANHGSEALKAHRSNPYELILMVARCPKWMASRQRAEFVN
jgi:CheY-like chemotaxis protein